MPEDPHPERPRPQQPSGASGGETRIPFRRPWVTWAILAGCLGAYWLTCPSGTTDPTEESLVRYGAKVDHLIESGQIWRLLSAAFLHGAWWHLAINAFALMAIGQSVESVAGARRYLCLFVTSAITASAASYHYNPGIAIGASGAVFGLFGAELVFMIKVLPLYHARHARVSCSALFSILLGLLFLAFNLVLGWLLPRIDNAAHIGGLLTGLVMGLAIPIRPPPRQSPWTELRLNLTTLLCLGLIGYATANAYDFAYRVTPQELALHVSKVRDAVEKELVSGPGPASGGRLSRVLSGPSAAHQFHRGVAFHRRKDLEKAGECYRKAIELNPEMMEAHFNLGLLLMEQGKQDEALEAFFRVIQLKPDAINAYLSIAEIYTVRGSFSLAHEQLSRALEKEPKNSDVHREIARLLHKTGQRQEALRHYQEALQLDPANARAHFYLGLLHVETGDGAAARRRHESLLGLDPHLAEVLHSRITSRFGAGE